MQLLYGNDGTNYSVISKSKEMTESQEKMLLDGYCGYNFVKNVSKYSGPSQEPRSFLYVTTNLSNTLSEEKILIGQSARMSNYVSPSYYSHFCLLDKNEDVYGEGFFDIFQYSFVKDEDVKKYEKESIDDFQIIEKSGEPIDRHVIEKEKVYYIVALLLDTVDSISRALRLVLDVEGDGYNKRALEVIATIFNYIPYTLRKKIGFSTYVNANSSVSSRIKLCLYTKESLPDLGTEAVKLGDMEIMKKAVVSVDCKVRDFVKSFVNMGEEERQGWFRKFQRVFGMGEVKLEEHIAFFENYTMWNGGDLEEIRDKLAEYAYEESKKKEESYIFREFCSVISERFAEEKYLPQYQKIIRKLISSQKSFDFNKMLKGYLMLGEAVQSVEFEVDSFLKWEKRIISEEKKKFRGEELLEVLERKYDEIEEVKNGGIKFEKVNAKMREELNEEIDDLKKEIEHYKNKEKKDIEEFFSKSWDEEKNFSESWDNRFSNIRTKYEKIQFADNKKFFQECLYKKINSKLEKIGCFCNYDEYEKYKQRIETCKDYLEEGDKRKLLDTIERKGVERGINYYKAEWKDKSDILQSYQEAVRIDLQAEKNNIKLPKCIIRICIRERQFEFEIQELKEMMLYLLFPREAKEESFLRAINREQGLIRLLIEIKAFSEGHFRCLTTNIRDESERKRLWEYYINEEGLLTENDVLTCLDCQDLDYLKMVAANAKNTNIIVLTLANKKRKNRKHRGIHIGRQKNLQQYDKKDKLNLTYSGTGTSPKDTKKLGLIKRFIKRILLRRSKDNGNDTYMKNSEIINKQDREKN